MTRRAVVAALLALAVALAAAPAASAASTVHDIPASTGVTLHQTAATQGDPNALSNPPTLDRPPPGRRLSAEQVLRIVQRLDKIRAVLRQYPRATSRVFLKGTAQWQVSYYSKAGKEIGQVLVDDPTGLVVEAWTGYQVAWTMARGYPGAFGRKAGALYVWLPLLVLFVVPFVDRRRLLRMRHLDLLALCSLSISLAFFSHGNIGLSVPLAYPPLLYLLVRLLWIGLRRGGERPREELRLLVPPGWLALGVVFLLGFRIGLDVTNSNVIDVGYAGVIGAHKLLHGMPLYGHFPHDNPHGDTYGPVNYLAYVPFVAIFGWSGTWDALHAAHAAAIAFDLLCVGGMYLLGRRLRGPVTGVALAWAWAAFPFTLFSEACNANDALVAALVIGALLTTARPVRSGALAVLAGLTKFAPLALAPLLAAGEEGRRPTVRRVAAFGAGYVVVGAAVLVPVLVHGDLSTMYDRTLGFQAGRPAPFSVWGLWGLPSALRSAVEVAAVALALVLPFVPRRRDLVGLSALCGAVLIALQLGLTYWFYLYVIWFLPCVLVAFLAADAEPLALSAPAPAAVRSPRPAAVAST